jgi:hypothetical protein
MEWSPIDGGDDGAPGFTLVAACCNPPSRPFLVYISAPKRLLSFIIYLMTLSAAQA